MKKKIKEKKPQKIAMVWFFIKQHKLYFSFILGMATLVGIAEALNVAVLYPVISQIMSVAGISDNPILEIINPIVGIIPIDDELIRYSVFFIFISFFIFITKTVYYYVAIRFISKVIRETKQKIFNKCINADYQFFVDHKQGEIIYKISDAPASLMGIFETITDIFVEFSMILAVFFALLTMSWKLIIVLLIGGIIYFYAIRYLSVAISYKAGRKQRDSAQKERVIINEYTTGIKQIKVFETFSYWRNMFDKVLDTFWTYYAKNLYWNKLPEIILWLVIYLSIGVSIIVIKIQYPGNFMAVLPLIGTFAFGIFRVLPKISKFGSFRMKFMHLMPNIEIVHDFLQQRDYSTIENGSKKFTGLKKGIELRNINFSHKERDILFSHLSLLIQKDKTTALVGPSGSGKSTIVNLILRLFDVQSGGVYIDDVNIREYDVFSFLGKVGFVSQETFIFNSSIKENISFGNEYTDEEIINAGKMANADGFISKLPEGYDTLVGDRGVRLSGGEKQRIALARAMIRKPEILILDEATSSLDNISEEIVQQAINKVSKNCTTFVIAHRLSTIQHADVIHVLDEGTIIESGSHENLLQKKGKYWELYTKQKIK